MPKVVAKEAPAALQPSTAHHANAAPAAALAASSASHLTPNYAGAKTAPSAAAFASKALSAQVRGSKSACIPDICRSAVCMCRLCQHD